ncbi:MAG TPA: isoprenylcysteine carboxylmethyltransferase family protein [Hanamia sp.]
MTHSHWILLFAWILYYVVHSILAATVVKDFFAKKMRKYFRYYRLCYSIFAAITLIYLLMYQCSFESPVLIKSVLLKYISLIILLIPGFIIMFISIKKYFLLLSGVRSIYEAAPRAELKVEGIHRYVRHPLYLGTILFVWGLFFIFPMLNNLIAVVLLTGYVWIGIGFEEKKLVKEFGKKYEDYISEVPVLFPGFKIKK